ncbi:MAG: flagellar biosynthetic protein FliO [Sphingobacteriia bacterium]|nr:flagellar biosynthetic protein FliO [Sphingobacteriia bacterium]NCC39006.1 flagellar biosynthetic protein FliO [Gammaproteobacteria bacterium]
MLLSPCVAWADEGADPPGLPALATSLGEMLLALVVVIALLLATLWAIRRLTLPALGNRAMKLLGSVAVGPRERVVLLAIADQVLVLGVGGGGVRTLHVLPISALESSTPVEGGRDTDARFAEQLKRLLEPRRDGH